MIGLGLALILVSKIPRAVSLVYTDMKLTSLKKSRRLGLEGLNRKIQCQIGWIPSALISSFDLKIPLLISFNIYLLVPKRFFRIFALNVQAIKSFLMKWSPFNPITLLSWVYLSQSLESQASTCPGCLAS